MGKIKISNKRRKSSRNMSKKTYRLKKGAHLSTHNPLRTLTNEKLVAQAFWECLRDNDPEGAMEILNAHLNAVNKVQFAKESDVPRSTVYHSMKSKNPTLRTVAKLIHCSV